ncbi:MAG TPA: lysophospholipid acyltransferase family protein [Myxococcales bacterium]|nr:lysophospholipid acyltransferase family protein [Myxococcales bacterium]
MTGPFARLVLWLGAALGALAYALGIRRAVALDNLARAFPGRDPAQRRALARGSYRSLGRALAETVLARRLPDAELAALIRFDRFDRYEEARAAGKGVIVAVAHFGNWELLARACARRGVPLTAITRRLRGRLNRWLLAARREGGLRELPDKEATRDALLLLRRGETLAVVVDQNMLRRRGIFVDFFGTPACTTPAAAVLALRSGAPVIAAFPVREADGRHRVLVEGPFAAPAGLRTADAVRALTQQITSAVERAVRDHPEQWFWVHRRWKTRP